jgi:hypothetical protein
MKQKLIKTSWHPDRGLLVTQISGEITINDIIHWEGTLSAALAEIADGMEFKILVDLFGFKAIDIQAHKRFRAIIPSMLSQYGWKVGYVDLFPEQATSMVLSNLRKVKCIAAAHCHHDISKMELYQREFGRHNERFFTDVNQAQGWISSWKCLG